MARIVPAADNVERTPFDEPVFATEESDGDRPARAAAPELLTPDALRRRAQAQAESLIRTARTEADQLRVVAEAEGRAAGEIAGKIQALEEHRAAAGTLGALTKALEAENAQRRADMTRYVTEVALAIVGRVLGDLAEANPDVMRYVVEQALAALNRRDVVTVRVHPTLVHIVQRERDSLRRVYEDVKELNILGDDAITPGGCILDSSQVSIDATIEHVIATMREDLLGAYAAPGLAPTAPPSVDTHPAPSPGAADPADDPDAPDRGWAEGPEA